MNFGDSIRTCLSKYATFQGRASRSELWFFYLFYIIVVMVAAFLDGLIGTGIVLYSLALLGLMLPIISAIVRVSTTSTARAGGTGSLSCPSSASSSC